MLLGSVIATILILDNTAQVSLISLKPKLAHVGLKINLDCA